MTETLKHSVVGPQTLILALTTFAAGLSEFIVIGLLVQIAETFNVTLSQSGLLVVVYALGISIGAPLLTLLTLKFNARSLSVILIFGFAILSLLTTVVKGFVILLLIRLASGLFHGAYFSITIASLPTLFNVKQTTMAIAIMFSGLTVAMVLGVPIGITLASTLGWQTPFVLIGIVSGVSAIALWKVLPKSFGNTDDERPTLVLFNSLKNKNIYHPYGITLFAFGGGFVFFTYAEPWLSTIAGLSGDAVALTFGLVGVGALVGNIMGGVLSQKFGRYPTLTAIILLQVISLIFLFIKTSFIPIFLFLFLWSVGAFAVAPIVQDLAISLSKDINTRFTSSLNITAFNIGLSMSSYLATWQVSMNNMAFLPLIAGVLIAISLPICFFKIYSR